MSKKYDRFKYEETLNAIEGIATLIESIGYRVTHDGASEVDYSAFCTLQEMLLEKKDILENYLEDLMEIEHARIAEKNIPIKAEVFIKPLTPKEYDELVKKAPPKPDNEVSEDDPA